jgi:hypothetical protein
LIFNNSTYPEICSFFQYVPFFFKPRLILRIGIIIPECYRNICSDMLFKIPSKPKLALPLLLYHLTPMETLLLYSHIQLLFVLLFQTIRTIIKQDFAISGCNAKSDGYIQIQNPKNMSIISLRRQSHWSNALSGFRAYIRIQIIQGKSNSLLCI